MRKWQITHSKPIVVLLPQGGTASPKLRRGKNNFKEKYHGSNFNETTLLEAGVHFGHQTRRWNPKMAKYIFTERNGIHYRLATNCKMADKANEFVRTAANDAVILFVGT